MGKLADGIVIGSALVERIAKLPVHEPHTSADLQHCTALIGMARDVINKIK